MKITENRIVQQNSAENAVANSAVVGTDENNDLVAFRIEDDSIQADETAYLLRSAKNRRRLLEAIAQVEHGQGRIRELIE